jgi:hypothetical protein
MQVLVFLKQYAPLRSNTPPFTQLLVFPKQYSTAMQPHTTSAASF